MSQAQVEGFIIRQLFDKESFTYTYILGDTSTQEAVLIDPVFEQAERDLKAINHLDMKLKYVMNTHLHADHITGTGLIKKMVGCEVKSVISQASEATADVKVKEGDHLNFGRYTLHVLSTPGHTTGCVTYVFHDGRMAFTGDSLLIGGCGRTDMQGGCALTLYNSIYKKLFTLDDDYMVYPGHDYKGRTCSTIGEEKRFNLRLNRPILEFVGIMEDFAVKWGSPKLINVALPANRTCGLYDLPPEMQEKVNSLKKKK